MSLPKPAPSTWATSSATSPEDIFCLKLLLLGNDGRKTLCASHGRGSEPRLRPEGACLARTMRRGGILLVLLLLTAACRPQGAPEVVKLGLIAPFEGPSRPLGYDTLAAVRFRLQQWNESSAEPKVELVALNDDGSPDLAARLPAQLAVDPEVLVALGPPQGQTALAAVQSFQTQALPVISLAPLPEAVGAGVAPYAGTVEEVQRSLAQRASGAIAAWQAPITTTTLWLGDPLTLAEERRLRPELVPAAGAVAGEEAFAAWAGPAANGLVWAAAAPETSPDAFVAAFAQATGAPPNPQARLAYAATGEALKLISEHRSRAAIAAAMNRVASPSIHLFVRQDGRCCQPLGN